MPLLDNIAWLITLVLPQGMLFQSPTAERVPFSMDDCRMDAYKSGEDAVQVTFQISTNITALPCNPSTPVLIQYEAYTVTREATCQSHAKEGRCSLDCTLILENKFYTYKIWLVAGNKTTVDIPWTPENFKDVCLHAPAIAGFDVVGTSKSQLNISLTPKRLDDYNDYGEISVEVYVRSRKHNYSHTLTTRCDRHCIFAEAGLKACTEYKVCAKISYSDAKGEPQRCLWAKTNCASTMELIPTYTSVGCFLIVLALLTLLTCLLRRALRKHKSWQEANELIEPRNNYQDVRPHQSSEYIETVIAVHEGDENLESPLIDSRPTPDELFSIRNNTNNT